MNQNEEARHAIVIAKSILTECLDKDVAVDVLFTALGFLLCRISKDIGLHKHDLITIIDEGWNGCGLE